jgi:hypothetical protein
MQTSVYSHDEMSVKFKGVSCGYNATWSEHFPIDSLGPKLAERLREDPTLKVIGMKIVPVCKLVG